MANNALSLIFCRFWQLINYGLSHTNLIRRSSLLITAGVSVSISTLPFSKIAPCSTRVVTFAISCVKIYASILSDGWHLSATLRMLMAL